MFSPKNIPDLAGRLRHVREAMGLSQIELAKIATTTQQAIQQAESGKAKNPRYLHKLSLILDIPYEWLTMNIMPVREKPGTAHGFSDKGRDVLDNFYAMPKKDQALLLELMKTRAKPKK